MFSTCVMLIVVANQNDQPSFHSPLSYQLASYYYCVSLPLTTPALPADTEEINLSGHITGAKVWSLCGAQGVCYFD